jgi:hypothetical protein
MAKDIAQLSFVACHLEENSVNITVDMYKVSHESESQWSKMMAWAQSFEYLRLLGSPKALQDAVGHPHDGDLDVVYAVFN